MPGTYGSPNGVGGGKKHAIDVAMPPVSGVRANKIVGKEGQTIGLEGFGIKQWDLDIPCFGSRRRDVVDPELQPVLLVRRGEGAERERGTTLDNRKLCRVDVCLMGCMVVNMINGYDRLTRERARRRDDGSLVTYIGLHSAGLRIREPFLMTL
jgi:hypothetical protein